MYMVTMYFSEDWRAIIKVLLDVLVLEDWKTCNINNYNNNILPNPQQ